MMDVKDVKEMYETAVRRMVDRWDFMLMCYDAVAGRQWTEKEKDYYEKYKMTLRTFNMLHTQMVTLDGVLIAAQQNPKTFPVEPGDFEISGVLTDTLQHELRETKAQTVYRSVQMDAAICGWGWGQTTFRKSSRYIDGQIAWDRINPFDGLADLDDENPSIMHDRWRGVSRWGTSVLWEQAYGGLDDGIVDELRDRSDKLFGPEESEEIRKGFKPLLERAMSNVVSFTRNRKVRRSNDLWDKKQSDYIDKVAGMLRGIEIHYLSASTRLAIIDPDSTEPIQIPEEYQEDTQENRELIKMALDQLGLDESAIDSRFPFEEWREVVAIPGLIPDEVLFDLPYAVQGRGCAIWVLEAFSYDPRKNERISIVSQALDAQRRANRAMSLQEEWIKRRQFPDLLAAKGQIPAEELQTWKSHEMGRMLIWDPRGDQTAPPPRYVEAPGLESLIQADLSVNFDLIPRLTGIPSALGGEKDSKKDGADLYASMVQMGTTMIKPFLQQSQDLFKLVCEFSLDTIQKFYTAKRWIRQTGKKGVVDPDGSGYYINDWDYLQGRPINDLDVGKYDVVLDTAPLSAVQREAKFAQRVQFLGLFDPMLREFTYPELLEMSGWDDAPELLRKWEVTIRIKYAPYGDVILMMLQDENAFITRVQNGEIDNQMLAGIKASMMMQGPGMGEMREGMEFRKAMIGEQQQGVQPNPNQSGMMEESVMNQPDYLRGVA